MPAEKPQRYANLNVPPETRDKAEKFATVLSKEKGVKVSRMDAVRIAIDEAMERRKKS